MPLPKFEVVGNLNEILARAGSGQIRTRGWSNARIRFTCNVKGVLVWEGQVYSRPPTVEVWVQPDGTFSSVEEPVLLLAADPALNVESTIQHQAEVIVGKDVTASWWFNARAEGVEYNLAADVPPPGTPAGRGPAAWNILGAHFEGDDLIIENADGSEFPVQIESAYTVLVYNDGVWETNGD